MGGGQLQCLPRTQNQGVPYKLVQLPYTIHKAGPPLSRPPQTDARHLTCLRGATLHRNTPPFPQQHPDPALLPSPPALQDDDPASQQPDIGVCSISLSQALRARGRSCGGKPQRLTVPVMAPCGARGGGDGEGGSEDDRGGEGGGGGVRRGYLAVTVVWEPCGAQHEAEGDGSTHEVAATAAAAAATGVLAAASAAGAADVLSAHHTALQSVQHAVTTELEDTAAEAPSAAVQEAETDLSLQSDSSAAQRAPSWARQRSKARYPQIFPYAYPPWPPTCSAAHGSALSDEPHDGPLPLRPGPGPAATATMRHLRTSSSSRRGAALRARDALRVGLWKRGGGGEGEASACLLVRARTA